MEAIEDMINSLPPELQREVKDFVEYLSHKYTHKEDKGKLSLDWAGGLKKYRDEYTALELQEKAMEWWGH